MAAPDADKRMRLANDTDASAPIALVPKREKGKQKLLSILDDLRAKVESGEIVAFAAVGIQPDDVTLSWQGCTHGVTNLRLVGAVACLLHSVHMDIDE